MRNQIRKRTAIVTSILLSFVLLLALVVPSYAAAEDSTQSDAMVLEIEGEGDVTVIDQDGNTVSVSDHMQLPDGCTVTTGQRSYAWIALDDTKEVGLDSESNMEILKDGKTLELTLNEGNMFFDVSEKLEDDETMDISTANMDMGIRGTFGVVEAVNNMQTTIILLDGNTEISALNAATGNITPETLATGQTGSVQLLDDGTADISIVPAAAQEIPGFTLQYLAEHNDTVQRIEDNDLDLDIEELIENADERLEEDEQAKEEKLAEAEAAHAADLEAADDNYKPSVSYVNGSSGAGISTFLTTTTGHTHSWMYISMGAHSHERLCPLCSQRVTDEPHNMVYRSNGDGTHTHVCAVCGYTGGAAEACTVSYTSDESGHTAACSVCGYTGSTEEHSFGEYTSAGASGHTQVCSVCGYSATQAHNMIYRSNGDGTHTHVCTVCGYTDGAAETCTLNFTVSESGHTGTCTVCGYTGNTEAHSFGDYTSAGASGHTKVCSVCGYSASQAHDMVYQSNGNGTHTHVCSVCGYTDGDAVACTLSYTGDESGHTGRCPVCGYTGNTEAHSFGDYTSTGASGHTKVCSVCGYSATQTHDMVYRSNGDGTHTHVCTVCGYTDGDAVACTLSYTGSESGHTGTCSICGYTGSTEAHSFGDYTSTGASGHTKVCSVCGYSATQAHDMVYQSNGDGTHTHVCSVCGYTDGDAVACTLSYTGDESGHTGTCSICGYTDSMAAHSFGDYTAAGASGHTQVCSVCGYSVTQAHNMIYRSNGDGTHTHVCADCGYTDGETGYCDEHYTYTSDASGHTGTCSLCGYTGGSEGHDWISFVSYNDSYHTVTCFCGYSSLLPHDFSESMVCYQCDHAVETVSGGASGEISAS